MPNSKGRHREKLRIRLNNLAYERRRIVLLKWISLSHDTCVAYELSGDLQHASIRVFLLYICTDEMNQEVNALLLDFSANNFELI